MHHGKSTDRVRLPAVWSLLVAGIAIVALVNLYISTADFSGLGASHGLALSLEDSTFKPGHGDLPTQNAGPGIDEDEMPNTGGRPPSPLPVPIAVPDGIVFEMIPPVDPATYIVDPVSERMRQSRRLVDSHIQSDEFKARVKRIQVHIGVGVDSHDKNKELKAGVKRIQVGQEAQQLMAKGVWRFEVSVGVCSHIKSKEFKARVKRIRDNNLTGIVMSAGGALFIANALVTLKVVREHMNCSLPIELVWQKREEMDGTTWKSIESTFAPIRGIDLSTMRHPVLSLVREVKLERFLGKVFALLVSEFRHVLMVDADSMPVQWLKRVFFLLVSEFGHVLMVDADSIPVQDPLNFFQHPLYQAAGNLMWPDAWQGKVQGRAYQTFGLKPAVVQLPGNVFMSMSGSKHQGSPVLAVTLLLDVRMSMQLDALEYLVWINSHPKEMEGVMWGDKDSFAMAFALAGKAHMYSQVAVPPGMMYRSSTLM
eukprot:gene6699-3368_t